jgi:hypothetical protein
MNAADQHGHVSVLPAAVAVEFIEHQEIETVGIGDDGAVEVALARHQQFELGLGGSRE